MERTLFRKEFEEGFKEITTQEEANEIDANCVFYTLTNQFYGNQHWTLIHEKDLPLAIANTPLGWEARATRKRDLLIIATSEGGYVDECNFPDRKERNEFVKKVQAFQQMGENAPLCPFMDENSPLSPSNQ